MCLFLLFIYNNTVVIIKKFADLHHHLEFLEFLDFLEFLGDSDLTSKKDTEKNVDDTR